MNRGDEVFVDVKFQVVGADNNKMAVVVPQEYASHSATCFCASFLRKRKNQTIGTVFSVNQSGGYIVVLVDFKSGDEVSRFPYMEEELTVINGGGYETVSDFLA